MRLLTADYCGIGHPFTVEGVPLGLEVDRVSVKAKPAGKRLRGRNKPGHVRRQQTEARDGQMLKLRLAGYDYRAISEAVGCSVGAAFQGVHRALNEYREATTQDADVLRKIEVARMNSLLTKLAKAVDSGDAQAALRVVQVSKRLSELLGLDAPTKTEVGNLNGAPLQHKITVEFV